MNSNYHDGLWAAANFIKSGNSFEKWYGDGPYDIDKAWLYLLQSLGRENKFHQLKEKLQKEYQNDNHIT